MEGGRDPEWREEGTQSGGWKGPRVEGGRDPEWREEGTQSGGRSAPEVAFVQSIGMYCMQGIYAMISAVTMSGLGCYTGLRYLNCA